MKNKFWLKLSAPFRSIVRPADEHIKLAELRREGYQYIVVMDPRYVSSIARQEFLAALRKTGVNVTGLVSQDPGNALAVYEILDNQKSVCAPVRPSSIALP